VLGYTALIFGFWPQLCRWRLVNAVACVGRMALSNYLLQTLICTTLFLSFRPVYEIRPLHCWRLLFRSGPSISLLCSLAALFPSGPVEWLWRQLTACCGDIIERTSR
jgi:uncharacterized protein